MKKRSNSISPNSTDNFFARTKKLNRKNSLHSSSLINQTNQVYQRTSIATQIPPHHRRSSIYNSGLNQQGVPPLNFRKKRRHNSLFETTDTLEPHQFAKSNKNLLKPPLTPANNNQSTNFLTLLRRSSTTFGDLKSGANSNSSTPGGNHGSVAELRRKLKATRHNDTTRYDRKSRNFCKKFSKIAKNLEKIF